MSGDPFERMFESQNKLTTAFLSVKSGVSEKSQEGFFVRRNYCTEKEKPKFRPLPKT